MKYLKEFKKISTGQHPNINKLLIMKNKQETYQDLEKETNNKYLENWVFVYNPYQNVFMATNRDNYSKLFNDTKIEAIIKSRKIEVLFEIINLNKGDLRKVINWSKNFK